LIAGEGLEWGIAPMLVIQLLNGLSFGALLFFMAAGLSLMFGLMRVVNLAHGSYFMIGAYTGWFVAKTSGSFLLAVVVSLLTVSAVGFLMERFFIRFLYRQELEQFMLTFGFIYIFADAVRWAFGGHFKMLSKPDVFSGIVSIMEYSFPVYRLVLILVAMAVGVGLWLFQSKTRLGTVIRAGVDDAEMVRALGINIWKIFTLVFTLGAALAAFGGVMACPLTGAYLGMDLDIVILSFVVLVVGGMESLKGAAVASFLIGEVDTFGKAFLPELAMVMIFVVMTVVLIIRPSGLFGKAVE
jgi:branched-chain amino acid transport system permease protein